MIITQLSVNLERKSVFLVKMRNTDFLVSRRIYNDGQIIYRLLFRMDSYV